MARSNLSPRTHAIGYDLHGSGAHGDRRALFLHGFLGCRQDWQAATAGCGDDFAILSVDLPGHGDSPIISDAWPGLEASGESVIVLLDHLGWDVVDVVGYSLGGRLALHLAVHYPDRIDRIIVESASPGLRTAQERELRREQDETLAKKLERTPYSEWLREWYQQPLFESLCSRREEFNLMYERRLKADPTGLAWSLRHMGLGVQESLWDSLPSIRRQVLFIVGELDRKFCRTASEMASLCTNSEVAIFENCGHTVHFEQPRAYIDRMKQFLFQGR